MKTLLYLYFLQMKANVRYVFSKPSTAIFTILIILIYGGMCVSMLFGNDATMSTLGMQELNIALFVGIGFTAFMVSVMLMQSKKTLFMEHDAFYVFTGPFKRSQAMQFIMSQSLVSATMCAGISIFMMLMLGSSAAYTFSFIVLAFITHFLVYIFFTILYYYTYLLTIQNERYKKIVWFIVGVFIVSIIGVFAVIYVQNHFSIHMLFSIFLNTEAFYYVPLFGWIKMVLVAFVEHNTTMLTIGMALLCGSCATIYYLMLNYKTDFVEQAMQDAVTFSKAYKDIREGKRTTLKDQKVRDIHYPFKDGAGAIYSKNMLMMKKTNQLCSKQDVIILVLYLSITFFLDLGYAFFIFMMIFWLFNSVQNADFMKEMEYYPIYLIPEPPMKKLMSMLLPYGIKYSILAFVSVVIGGVVLQAPFAEVVQYFAFMTGYAYLFISSSVLATKILKSRNNALMENLLRMLVICLSAIPSILLIVLMFMLDLGSANMILWMSMLVLLMNFIVSFLLLFSCKNMMNGREIKSE